MTCSRCSAWCAPSDNYCRQCGDKLVVVLPAVTPSRELAAFPVSLPSSVVKGVAVVVAGKALEWAVRAAARRLAGNAGSLARQLMPRPSGPLPAATMQSIPPAPLAAGMVVTEVLVLWQQVRRIDTSGRVLPPQR